MKPARLSLSLRNLIFVVLQPGLVAGLLPYWLAHKEFQTAFSHPWTFRNVLGIGIFLLGLFMLVYCVVQFVRKGRGTLSPADPTQNLVTTGLYRHSRNPMYIGVILMLLGELVISLSFGLLLYTLGIGLLFQLFIRYREEPRLKRDFGKEYLDYCLKVKRWI